MNMTSADVNTGTSARPTVLPPMVFIVDDDISIRESLEPFMRHEGFDVKTFSSASSFLEHPPIQGPGCVILDIAMPGLSGLELQSALVVDRPAMPIIFLTGSEDPPTIVRAMKAGAVEFLTKPFDDEALLDAVKSAVERSKTLVRNECRKTRIRRRYGDLTRREREVMSLVMQGKLNRDIGQDLGITEITVKAHRGQVMRKMEAASLAELIHMAADAGI